ncbi:MAG: creatininase family protein, partial [Pseudomonadota bacterium]
MTQGVWLETLTWVEAKSWFAGGAPVLVPIGAIAKEHGHHLPLNTDWMVARELTDRVLDELPIVAAPVVDFGFYPAFVRYPGSQHLRAETFSAVLKDILEKLVRDGVRRIAILNTGVSTEPVVHLAARGLLESSGVRVHTADIRRLGLEVEATLDQQLGGHGDEAETSMIMAIDRDAVRLDKAVTDYGNM